MNTVLRGPRLAVLAALIVSFACSDATAPEPNDLFVLSRVDGEPPPVVRARQSGLTILRTDTLLVLGDRRYVRTTVLEDLASSFVSTGPTETGVLEAVGGGRFILDADCPDLGICVAPDTIRFFDDGAEISRSYVLNGATLRYRRIH